MAEVDDDQSSTLDFYEYLKVSVIIAKKSGQCSAIYNRLVYRFIVVTDLILDGLV